MTLQVKFGPLSIGLSEWLVHFLVLNGILINMFELTGSPFFAFGGAGDSFFGVAFGTRL